jgi:hypothetical protein
MKEQLGQKCASEKCEVARVTVQNVSHAEALRKGDVDGERVRPGEGA